MPGKKIKLSIVTKDAELLNDAAAAEQRAELRTVLSVFRESREEAAHGRLFIQLKVEFYNKLNIEEFSEDFFQCMRGILLYQDRLNTEIPLLFCIKFVTICILESDNERATLKSDLLLKRLVKFITYHGEDADGIIRFNCVQAARILLTELTDDMPVPEILFEKLQAMLIKRFWDVKPYVRAEAARGSNRLQDPSDSKCPIVIGLMHICRFDSKHTVRLAALQALAITTKTLQCVIERVKDVHDVVRKKSFDLLIKWKILKPLSISARLSIIESGLNDKSNVVKSACVDLLKVWLITSDNNVVSLLKRLDVDNMEKITEMALYSLLESLTKEEVIHIIDQLSDMMDEDHLIKDEHLTGESAFLWRHLVIFITDKSDQFAGGESDKILPIVVNFEKYLRRLFQKPIDQSTNRVISLDEYAEYCTIIKHLLSIVNYIDIFDTYNRELIIDLIKWAMSSADIPFNYVHHLMELFVKLERNNVKICEQTVELINELLFTDNENDCHVIENKENITPLTNIPEIDVIDAGDVNKDADRKIRIEIAKVDVQINELKESINTGLEHTHFENMSEMIQILKDLEIRKKELLDSKLKLTIPLDILKTSEVIIEDLVDIDDNNGIKKESQDNPQWMTSGNDSRIIKANIMTITMIKECNMLWTMPSSLRSLFNNVVLVSIQHTNVCVREKAILALGLCCLLDKDLAVLYFSIFLKSLEVDVDEIKEVAVKSLTDLMIRFGIEPFQESIIRPQNSSVKEENTTYDGTDNTHIEYSAKDGEYALTEEEQHKCVSTLINPIVDLLNNEKNDLLTTAAICLSKLLYHHRIHCSKFLSRLLVMWFNPEHTNNDLLKSHLAVFFTNYSLMSEENQESIASCFILTVKMLIKAPASSPISEIDINNVVDWFLIATDSRKLHQNMFPKTSVENTLQAEVKDASNLKNPCHDTLGRVISNEILREPLAAEVKYYVSMLVRLRFSVSNVALFDEVAVNVAKIINKLKDKKSLSLLDKFNKELETRLRKESLDVPRDNIVTSTPIFKPVLLEVNSNNELCNSVYIATLQTKQSQPTQTCEVADSIADSVSNMTIVENITDSSFKTINTPRKNKVVHKTPQKNVDEEPSKINNDQFVFKEPLDIRVTRSSIRKLPILRSSSVVSVDISKVTVPKSKSATKKK